MKKVLMGVAAVLAALPQLAGAAAGNHPMGGCGLGYVLYGKGSNSNTVQICAYTTNSSSSNQLFGITSGTSGCTPQGLVAFNKETERYVEINYESLRSDLAKGSGEYVNGLMNLLGVKEIKRSAVILLLKQDYAQLFPSQNTAFDEFMRHLQRTLTDHYELLA